MMDSYKMYYKNKKLPKDIIKKDKEMLINYIAKKNTNKALEIINNGLATHLNKHDVKKINYLCHETNNFKIISELYNHGIEIDKQRLTEVLINLIDSNKRNILEIIKKSIKLGVDINNSDFSGTTPLMTACRRNNFDIVNFLIENGANINHKNIIDDTPLHHAVYENDGKFEIIDLLIENGANIQSLNEENRSASDYARDEENFKLAEYIDSYEMREIKNALSNKTDLYKNKKKTRI